MCLLDAVAFSKKLPWLAQNQGNYFENATACSKHMRKTLVATQLISHHWLVGALMVVLKKES